MSSHPISLVITHNSSLYFYQCVKYSMMDTLSIHRFYVHFNSTVVVVVVFVFVSFFPRLLFRRILFIAILVFLVQYDGQSV